MMPLLKSVREDAGKRMRFIVILLTFAACAAIIAAALALTGITVLSLLSGTPPWQ